MRNSLMLLIGFSCCLLTVSAALAAENVRPVLVIHGGAGAERKDVAPALAKQYNAALAAALKAGYGILERGGTAVDAVETAVRSMEDSRQFNAGAGAVFDHDGHNTLDASIMDGKTHAVGAVACITVAKNPIDVALAVMRNSRHVMFIGEGANQFARQQKLAIVEPKYFYTKRRWLELQDYLAREKAAKKASVIEVKSDHRFGTVGAVALDRNGNLAAGTSTGGLTGKRFGRVGDSPVIGAGTYADDASCAVSCTGHGEWFIRYNVASDIAARVKYQHKSVKQAADEVIHGVLNSRQGEGGVIALDRKGNFAMPFNCEGMYRGYTYDGTPHTFIFDGDTAGSARGKSRGKS